MNLQLDRSVGSEYTSKSRIAGLCSEAWVAAHLYCSACSAKRLTQLPKNTRGIDYRCDNCASVYQLKSAKRFSDRVMDAAHKTMIAAIRSDAVPNLLVMHYDTDWCIRNLMLVPSFFFTESCIEARKPLSPDARRAGHVLCDIMLNRIAPEGKLWIVKAGDVTSVKEVRRQYESLRPLSELSVGPRGWTLDVLRVIHKLNRKDFSLADVYAFDEELGELHPSNKNVRPKIRQQLQILRDVGLLDFVGHGAYRLR